MDDDMPNLNSGDRLVLMTGVSPRVWVISTVNNQVVKYFDENGRYGQMPFVHLIEMVQKHQVKIEKISS